MMKAASLPIGLSLLLGLVAYAQAPDPQESAVNEAVIRQASHIALRQKLADALNAQGRHDLPTAAKLYDDAWELVQKVGPDNVQSEADTTRAGLSAVRLELARQAQSHDDFKGAAVDINDVLRVDPSNAVALELKRSNEKLLAEQRGRIPDAETQNAIPGIVKERLDAGTLVQDGKLLWEMGKSDEAKKKLQQAVKIDPQNQAAYYYLNLINEMEYKRAENRRDVDSRERLVDIEKAWAKPVKRELLPEPNLYSRTNLIFTSPSRQRIYAKLDKIRLDNVSYDGLPLTDVVKMLSDEAQRRDPTKQGINFLVNQNTDNGASENAPIAVQSTAVDPATGLPIPTAAPSEQVDMSQILIKIVPPLRDVRLADVLDAIIKVADRPIK
jgi:hypothetical protein